MEFPEEGINYYIYVTELPQGIHAMLLPNDDATFSLYLDSRRSREQWLDDWTHEMKHIIFDDFYNNDSIQIIERRAAS